MTEKRFRVQEHCLRSSDGIEAENWLVTNDNHSVVLNNKLEAHMVANMCNDVIDVLNALHEENQQLRDEIQDFQNLLTEREETFLKPIRLALDDAIENERTHIGRNVLKQFKQTIME